MDLKGLLTSANKLLQQCSGNLTLSAENDLGRKLFFNFYNIGIFCIKNKTSLENEKQLLSETRLLIVKQQTWIQIFISNYAVTRVDFEGGVSAKEICMTRSGFKFLNETILTHALFNQVVQNLKVNGDIETFDERLKTWIEGGFREDLREQDVDKNIPSTHWWWF